jgi:hypothetical protein
MGKEISEHTSSLSRWWHNYWRLFLYTWEIAELAKQNRGPPDPRGFFGGVDIGCVAEIDA